MCFTTMDCTRITPPKCNVDGDQRHRQSGILVDLSGQISQSVQPDKEAPMTVPSVEAVMLSMTGNLEVSDGAPWTTFTTTGSDHIGLTVIRSSILFPSPIPMLFKDHSKILTEENN